MKDEPRVPVVPHRWDGKKWTCVVCGHVSPDPCTCRCHRG